MGITNKARAATLAAAAGLALAAPAAPALAGTVSYDLNGPAGVVHEHAEDGDVEVEEIGVDFDGLGELTGWNTRPDGTGDAYKAGDKVAGDATLYAQYSDGTLRPADGLNAIGGKRYYYEGGEAKTGLIEVSGALMYFDEADGGAAAASRLVETGGKRYYAGDDGRIVTDELREVGGKTYYFGADGASVTGVAEVAGAEGAELMYFAADGARVDDGWAEDGGRAYLARGGVLMRSRLADDAGRTYAFGDDGAQLGGHVEVAGKWYVCDGAASEGVRAGWAEKGCWAAAGDDGELGYAGEDGALLVGLQEFDGVAHWFDGQGVARGGWHATGVGGERAWCRSIAHNGMVVEWSAAEPDDKGEDKSDSDKDDQDDDKKDAAAFAGLTVADGSAVSPEALREALGELYDAAEQALAAWLRQQGFTAATHAVAIDKADAGPSTAEVRLTLAPVSGKGDDVQVTLSCEDGAWSVTPDPGKDTDKDSDSDKDKDTDKNSDKDKDTGKDSDKDKDTGKDSDKGSDSDKDTDKDSGKDTGKDSDSDKDSDKDADEKPGSGGTTATASATDASQAAPKDKATLQTGVDSAAAPAAVSAVSAALAAVCALVCRRNHEE